MTIQHTLPETIQHTLRDLYLTNREVLLLVTLVDMRIREQKQNGLWDPTRNTEHQDLENILHHIKEMVDKDA